MAMKERHKALARLFWRRITLVSLMAVSVFAAFAVWGVYKKEQESRMLRLQAESQLYDLQDQQRNLSERISGLNTQKGKEAILREQYGVAKSGESVVIIVEAEKADMAPEESGVRVWVRKFVPFW